MRTKTLLLAGAALAFSLATSQAQVYSQNVVGYANVPMVNNSTYLLTIPFNIGASNGANEVWPLSGGNPTIPDSSTLLVWNGSGYSPYLSDSQNPPYLWDDGNGNPLSYSPVIPVGQGFFLIPAGNVTSTFAGSVAVPIGANKPVALLNNVTYLIASYVPYSGAVSAGNSAGGGLNLSYPGTGLPDSSTLLLWNGSGYTPYLSDSQNPPGYWDDGNGNPLVTPPSVSVAEGFFLIPGGNFTWTVGLTP